MVITVASAVINLDIHLSCKHLKLGRSVCDATGMALRISIYQISNLVFNLKLKLTITDQHNTSLNNKVGDRKSALIMFLIINLYLNYSITYLIIHLITLFIRYIYYILVGIFNIGIYIYSI